MLQTGWETDDGVYNKPFSPDAVRYSTAAEPLNKPLPKPFILKCFLQSSLVNNATLPTAPPVSSAGRSSPQAMPAGSALTVLNLCRGSASPLLPPAPSGPADKSQLGLLLGHPCPFSHRSCSAQRQYCSHSCTLSHTFASRGNPAPRSETRFSWRAPPYSASGISAKLQNGAFVQKGPSQWKGSFGATSFTKHNKKC